MISSSYRHGFLCGTIYFSSSSHPDLLKIRPNILRQITIPLHFLYRPLHLRRHCYVLDTEKFGFCYYTLGVVHRYYSNRHSTVPGPAATTQTFASYPQNTFLTIFMIAPSSGIKCASADMFGDATLAFCTNRRYYLN